MKRLGDSNIGYKDNADILRSAVRWGACPNCYSTSHKDCTGWDNECIECLHTRYEHDGARCRKNECQCEKFVEECPPPRAREGRLTS